MTTEKMKGNWKQLKGKIKEKWGKLTDDDLLQAEGNAEQLVGRLQERYGYEKEKAKSQVDDFFRKNSEKKENDK